MDFVRARFLRFLSVALAVAFSSAIALVEVPSAVSAMGPKLTVVQPTADQVMTDSEFTIVFDVESRFPLAAMRITSREFDSNRQWWGVEFECNADGTRCEILVDVEEWEETYNFWWREGRFPIRVTAMDEYRVAGPPVQVIINLNLTKCGGIVYSPAPGEEVSGTVTVNVVRDCPDDSWGDSKTELYVDGKLVAADQLQNRQFDVHLWNSQTVPNGPHTLSVGGFDGTTRDPPSDAITVIVNNPPRVIVGFLESNWTPGKRVRKQKVSLKTLAGEPLVGRDLRLTVESEKGARVERARLKATTGQDGVATFTFDKPLGSPHILTANFRGDGVYPAESALLENKASWNVRYSVRQKSDRQGRKVVLRVKVTPAQKTSLLISYWRPGDTGWSLMSGVTNRRGVYRYSFRPEWRGLWASYAIIRSSIFRETTYSSTIDLQVR